VSSELRSWQTATPPASQSTSQLEQTSMRRFKNDREGQARRTELQARRAQAPGGAQAVKTGLLGEFRVDVLQPVSFNGRHGR
jgi:hypothetical protein